MISAIDTNILLDVLTPGEAAAASSKRLLERALGEGSLCVCEVVYAELAASFRSGDELDAFLDAAEIELISSPKVALRKAGLAWRKFARARRGAGLRCQSCGAARQVDCSRCGRRVTTKQHVLADFLIGGHAAALADRLLTRDLGYYGTHFPDLTLLSPS